MEHKTLVDAVVTAEWEMFSNVQNVGGKASCQMDPKTFRIMRSSQMDNWDDELLGSYLEDLLNARLEGRNLAGNGQSDDHSCIDWIRSFQRKLKRVKSPL